MPVEIGRVNASGNGADGVHLETGEAKIEAVDALNNKGHGVFIAKQEDNLNSNLQKARFFSLKRLFDTTEKVIGGLILAGIILVIPIVWAML